MPRLARAPSPAKDREPRISSAKSSGSARGLSIGRQATCQVLGWSLEAVRTADLESEGSSGAGGPEKDNIWHRQSAINLVAAAGRPAGRPAR